MQIIEKTAFLENTLAASMSPGMAASLDWSSARRFSTSPSGEDEPLR